MGDLGHAFVIIVKRFVISTVQWQIEQFSTAGFIEIFGTS